MVATRTLRNYLASLGAGNPGSLVGANLTLRSASGFATAGQGSLADTALQEVVGGDDIAIDVSDPQRPIINSTVVPGGRVDTVVAGPSIEVDATDPANPVVGLDAAAQTAIAEAGTSLQSVVGGLNVAIDNTDPRNPVINASGGEGGGTVSSVAMTVPTGLEVSGSPITITGTLAVTYAAGYQGYTTDEADKLALITVTGSIDLDSLAATVAGIDADLTTAEGAILALDGRVDAIETNGVTASAGFGADNRLLRADGSGKAAQASTDVYLDDSDRLLFGTATALTFTTGGALARVQLHATDDGGSGAGLFRYGANANGPNLRFLKSRAAAIGGRAVVQSGDLMGRLFAYGDDGTDLVPSVEVRMVVDGTPGTNDMPGRLDVFTAADGSATPVVRFRVDSAGLVSMLYNAYIAGTLDIGNASDTTLSRSAAGVLAVEGSDVLMNKEDQTLVAGARVTVKDLGNLSGNTITPDPGDRGIQKITNNGAGTVSPGSNYGTYYLDVINTTGAGAITLSSWTKVDGSFDTTTTSKFRCGCCVTADMSTLQILKVA